MVKFLWIAVLILDVFSLLSGAKPLIALSMVGSILLIRQLYLQRRLGAEVIINPEHTALIERIKQLEEQEELSLKSLTESEVGQRKIERENTQLQKLISELEAQHSVEEALRSFADGSGQSLDSMSTQIQIAIDEAELAITTAIVAFSEASQASGQLRTLAAKALDPDEGQGTDKSMAVATASMNDFINYILSIAQEIADSAERAQSLFKATLKLNDLLDQVERIASQTRLLSLNASIEAAHAGKSSHGFAAVAEEVRKLSGRSAEAAEQMRSLTQGLNSETSLICKKLNTSAQMSSSKATHAQAVLTKLGEVVQETKTESVKLITEISDRSDQIKQNLDRVVTAFQFQDLLRQRLEHVARPLRELSKGLRVMAGAEVEESSQTQKTNFVPSLTVVSYASNDDNVELFA